MKMEEAKYWEMLIKRGLSRFFMLCVLNKKSLHGYYIAEQIENCSCRCCAPTPGTVYPVLKEMIKDKYVKMNKKVVSGRIRKIYTLTERGKEAYKVAVKTWDRILPGLIEACGAGSS
jgi:DNA-binding PadR family transcriptional regulator